MKTINPFKTFNPLISTVRISLAVTLTVLHLGELNAQNLVVNSNFAGGASTGWSTGSSIEINPEPTYGGPSSSIYVTEIDVERTLNQQVCILPGLKYTFTFQASRRPQSGTPANPGVQVQVTGVTSNTSYVSNTQNYTNTAWSAQAMTFTFSIPANSTDKKVNIAFQSSNNSSTYGVLIWDIELAPAGSNPLSINGPVTSLVSAPNNYSLTNSPAAGVTYNWAFSSDANYATSAAAKPTGIGWASMGGKTVSVAVSNGACTMTTYTQAVTISAILPMGWAAFAGVVETSDAHLNWVAEQELDGRYFVVSRSTDGKNFDSIGVVTSLNEEMPTTYQYVDRAMPLGTVQYRITHVGQEENVSYSKVITLNNSGSGPAAGKLAVFPNPAVSTLNYTIVSGQPARADIRIYNTSGVLMMTTQAQLSAGANQQSVSLANLSQGSYFLKVIYAGGNSQAMQCFVKM